MITEIGEKFYRVTITGYHIEAFFYAGHNPKQKDHVLAISSANVTTVLSLKIETTNTVFYTTDYTEASKKYIEFKERDLQHAKEIFLKEQL